MTHKKKPKVYNFYEDEEERDLRLKLSFLSTPRLQVLFPDLMVESLRMWEESGITVLGYENPCFFAQTKGQNLIWKSY